jgi:16S rRNA (uracil1498-N3)-methyltransferase
MKKIRIFLKDQKICAGTCIAASKNHLHYLKDVMRINQGEEIYIFNGKDGEWIAKIDGNFILPQNQIAKQQKRENRLVLCFAVPKKQALKNIIRQTTELGVDILQPVYTKHTINKIEKTDKLELWATEAAEQCERMDVPIINKAIRFDKIKNTYENIFLCDESQRHQGKTDIRAFKSYTIVVGPEGGFCQQERESGFCSISLGKNILRCDTACATAVFYFKGILAKSGKI